MTDILPTFSTMPGKPMEIHKWLLTEGRLDVLRGRLTLSELVGQTVTLEQAKHGEMRGTCPESDHPDDQKSFFVSDRQGIYHCFGCGIHGDAIRWMTGYRNMGYVDALEYLVRKAGLLPTE